VSARVRQRLVATFVEWASRQGLAPPPPEACADYRNRLEILLQGREVYLGKSDPTWWKSGDVHALLMDYAVPRQVDLWHLAEHGVDALRQFIQFLDATDRLHPASAKPAVLRKELNRLTSKYPAAMADRRRYRLAKRIFTAMATQGLRPDADPQQLDRWAEEFNAQDRSGRRTVLGEMVDEPGYATGRLLIHGEQVAIVPSEKITKHMVWPDAPCECCTPASYPPITVPDDAGLAPFSVPQRG
jgi:hypothetical protein